MRNTLAFLLAFLLPAAAMGADPTSSEPPITGAIRWDTYYGENGPVKEVEHSLTPPKYHWRLPWFAKITGEGKVSINGDSPEIMEQEIAYAARAGLNYWAFLDYGPGHPMTRALDHYLAAPEKRGIRYCFIEQGARIDGHGVKDWPRIVRHFQDPNYLKVLDGRPVLFVFIKPERIGRKEFDELRAQTVAAGLKTPFLVLMGWSAAADVKDMEALGFDSVTAYAANVGYTMNPPSYAWQVSEIRRTRWEKSTARRIPSVTFVSAGWDTRPRNERPPSWTRFVGKGTPDPTPFSEQKPLIDAANATPAELATHLREAVEWTLRNRDMNPANLILIYAWNENDEGGWLIPTLGADGKADESRIEAVRSVLRSE